MICASCHEATEAEPCTACGETALLDGRYRLLRELGRGASGITWQAEGPDGEDVAIKEVSLFGLDPKRRELVVREARVLGELDHPAIPRHVEQVEFGRGKGRALWLVQERIDGQTLAEEAVTRRYGVDEVMALGEELLVVLEYLHGLSPPVLHRDLKPGNVMRRADGRLVLIDFGAVRDVLKGDLGGSTVAGTFGFMPPEQLVGDASPRSDLYGLGALMVALLTRKQPHTLLDHAQRLRWQAHAEVPPRVAEVLRALLEPDPEQRVTSARAARRLLAAARGAAREVAPVEAPDAPLQQPVKAALVPVAPPARRPGGRISRWWTGSLGAVRRAGGRLIRAVRQGLLRAGEWVGRAVALVVILVFGALGLLGAFGAELAGCLMATGW